MLFEVSKFPWKMETQQEWSQQRRVQAMIRKKKMKILKNSNYLIIRVYLSERDTGSLSVQWISRMQRKQLRGTGFFQGVLTTSLVGSRADGTKELSGFEEESNWLHIGPVQQCKKVLPCTAVWGPLCRLSGGVAGNTSARPSNNLQDSDWYGWAESNGSCLCCLWSFFHTVMSLWEFRSAACPASLGSKAVRTAPANKSCTPAGGLPPWFVHCGLRFYLAKLLHSQYEFNAVSDTKYGYCTLTFNYIKSYYNHFLYNKSSLTPEKLSSHGCSAAFLKSKTEEF